MDKKTIVIFILSIIIAVLLVGGGIGYRVARKRVNSALDRSAVIAQSARNLQAGYAELERKLDRERAIVTGLRETNDGLTERYKSLEQIYRELRTNYQSQTRIIERIESGDINIDSTIDRIEKGLAKSLEIVREIKGAEK